MKSVWYEGAVLPSFKKLEKNIKTDVLIVGGGMAGILCAYMLQQKGVKYILVESDKICRGVTANTTAKITSQHGLIYSKLISRFGVENARMYLQANEDAVKKYSELCSNIKCGFETKSSYVYSISNRKKLEKEMYALEKIGFKANLTENLPLPFPTSGAIEFKNQAQFNPLQFLASISENLNIYENTHVSEVSDNTAITDHGIITADKIIIATHFPFIDKHGGYFIKMYQHRSYVIALGNAPNVDGMYVDEAKKGMSFRNYNNLLLIGGGDHRTGKHGGKWDELSGFAKIYYPGTTEKYHWATQDCMTLDEVPYIGQYSESTPDLYVATGFNKWGMTSSMVSATILSDLVLGKSNPYSDVFSPSRTVLRPQLAVNAFEATVNMLTPTTKRCSHLGCALKWNPQEKTWDCTCHGSRFKKNGTVIDNPANRNLKK